MAYNHPNWTIDMHESALYQKRLKKRGVFSKRELYAWKKLSGGMQAITDSGDENIQDTKS